MALDISRSSLERSISRADSQYRGINGYVIVCEDWLLYGWLVLAGMGAL